MSLDDSSRSNAIEVLRLYADRYEQTYADKTVEVFAYGYNEEPVQTCTADLLRRAARDLEAGAVSSWHDLTYMAVIAACRRVALYYRGYRFNTDRLYDAIAVLEREADNENETRYAHETQARRDAQEVRDEEEI